MRTGSVLSVEVNLKSTVQVLANFQFARSSIDNQRLSIQEFTKFLRLTIRNRISTEMPKVLAI
jgi:hypothetical protein